MAPRGRGRPRKADGSPKTQRRRSAERRRKNAANAKKKGHQGSMQTPSKTPTDELIQFISPTHKMLLKSSKKHQKELNAHQQAMNAAHREDHVLSTAKKRQYSAKEVDELRKATNKAYAQSMGLDSDVDSDPESEPESELAHTPSSTEPEHNDGFKTPAPTQVRPRPATGSLPRRMEEMILEDHGVEATMDIMESKTGTVGAKDTIKAIRHGHMLALVQEYPMEFKTHMKNILAKAVEAGCLDEMSEPMLDYYCEILWPEDDWPANGQIFRKERLVKWVKHAIRNKTTPVSR